MKIDEMIQELNKIKEIYGNLEVVGGDDYDLDLVKVKKFIMTSHRHNSIITRQTEDLDEDSLEKMYIEDEDYKQFFVDKGICVKIY